MTTTTEAALLYSKAVRSAVQNASPAECAQGTDVSAIPRRKPDVPRGAHAARRLSELQCGAARNSLECAGYGPGYRFAYNRTGEQERHMKESMAVLAKMSTAKTPRAPGAT
jgi:hypothetical protein